MQTKIDEVLSYWFEETPVEHWYNGPEELDQDIKKRFLDDYNQAAAGELTDWEKSPRGSLALLILLDQFSRNMFRGSGDSFKADPIALGIAERAISAGHDMEFDERHRAFYYLPFMHSEDIDVQNRAVELSKERLTGEPLHAYAHRWVIEEYGRFPYRNEALGRASTDEEKAFLDAGAYNYALSQVQDSTE